MSAKIRVRDREMGCGITILETSKGPWRTRQERHHARRKRDQFIPVCHAVYNGGKDDESIAI